VPVFLPGEVFEQPVALVALGAHALALSTGVRLVHDDEIGRIGQKVLPPPVRLHEVETDHREFVALKDALARVTALFQAPGGAGQHGHRVDAELDPQFLHPLSRQVRWAQDRQAVDLAPVQQLAGD